MNIGKLAALMDVTPDTVRYYEKEGLLDAATRSANGYRVYTDNDVARLRFVRGAQAIGFSIAEIRCIVLRLAEGQMDRAEIESHLNNKLAQIDTTMRHLRGLRRELVATFSRLTCSPARPVSVQEATAEPGTHTRRVEVKRRRSIQTSTSSTSR